MNKKKRNLDFYFETKLWRQGYKFVVGLDEAGRGPLAGPVVGAAVWLVNRPANFLPFSALNAKPKVYSFATKRVSLPVVAGITGGLFKDSKKLFAKQREAWYKILTQHPNIKWGIGVVSEKIIDRINIFEATKLAMKKAIKSLGVKPDYLLIDGNFTLEDLPINQKAIVRGDERIFSCAAASIIAKVTRDRIMVRYAKKYPQYDFAKHKGYGTKTHFLALKKHGPCKIHRFSFAPLKNKNYL